MTQRGPAVIVVSSEAQAPSATKSPLIHVAHAVAAPSQPSSPSAVGDASVCSAVMHQPAIGSGRAQPAP